MRRVATALALFALTALLIAPAEAKKRHKPSGIDGVVLDANCYGPCIEPQPQQAVYAGPVTVTVHRASDGALLSSREVSDGKFRIRLKRGLYDVGAVPPRPPICPPDHVCIQQGPTPAAVIMPCLAGETKRVQVRRHCFSHVELHVTNACIL